MCLFSGSPSDSSSRRQRALPQRRWLIRRSLSSMLAASHGHSSTTSAAVLSCAATCRFSSALARRTRFACSSAFRCCGAASIVAVSPISLPGTLYFPVPDRRAAPEFRLRAPPSLRPAVRSRENLSRVRLAIKRRAGGRFAKSGLFVNTCAGRSIDGGVYTSLNALHEDRRDGGAGLE